MKKLTKTVKNEKGQSIMEYVIISGLIGIACFGAMKRFGDKLSYKIEKMEAKIGKVSVR